MAIHCRWRRPSIRPTRVSAPTPPDLPPLSLTRPGGSLCSVFEPWRADRAVRRSPTGSCACSFPSGVCLGGDSRPFRRCLRVAPRPRWRLAPRTPTGDGDPSVLGAGRDTGHSNCVECGVGLSSLGSTDTLACAAPKPTACCRARGPGSRHHVAETRWAARHGATPCVVPLLSGGISLRRLRSTRIGGHPRIAGSRSASSIR